MMIKEIEDESFLCTDKGSFQVSEIQRVLFEEEKTLIYLSLVDEPVVFWGEDAVDLS